MKKISALLLGLILFAAGVNQSLAGITNEVITTHLASEMETMKTNDFIRINITLAGQYDSQSLVGQARMMNKEGRRDFVVAVLKDFTRLSQQGVLADLNRFLENGQVRQITTYWIANVINCYATPSVIGELSSRSDIASIDYDETRVLIDPSEYKNSYFEEGMDGGKEITWNVLKINADDVWALGFTGEGVIVAVLDTGVNYNHVDLADHLWESALYPNHGYDFVNNDFDPMDDHGHGTHCAGTVAGDGTAGSHTGVAPDATIMCCKVLDSQGSGSESGVWAAVEFSIEQGADVLSLSLGWQHSWGTNRTVWRQTFDAALAAGLIASVAAGNEGDQQGQYPIPDNVRTPGDCPPPWLHPDQTLTGGISSVICVGATTQNDVVSGFSSQGPVDWSSISPYNDYPYQPEMGLIRPDICAPGSNIKSLAHYSNTGYESGWSGTSMATPANAGMIALMLQKNETLSPEDISQTVEQTAYVLSPGKNNLSGSGRIDALAAVEATSFPGPSYYAHVINDAAGNNDGFIDPGESILLTLSVANFSDEQVNNVTVKLTSGPPFISFTDSLEYFGDFSVQTIIEKVDAFAFDAAANIPGGEEIEFKVTAYNSQNSWESKFTVIPHGVNLSTGAFTISDPTGNNNGRLDPGETVDIMIETLNTGQNPAEQTMSYLTSGSGLVTINSGSFDHGAIAPGGSSVATFNITVDAATPVGASPELKYEVTSGAYNIEVFFYPKVGLIVEDFETGDFSQYDWQFAGNQPWTIVTGNVYEGTYCAKSGAIGNSQSAEMKLTLDILAGDSISFYRKVSSEEGYDFLEFYIGNVKVGEWAGEAGWERVAFPVSAGQQTFRWVYIKDVFVVGGSDCAWVDFIELPAYDNGNMTVFAGPDTEICEGEVYETAAIAQNYNNLLWETSGTGTFDDNTSLITQYNPSALDYETGSVTLTLTVYGDGGTFLFDNVVVDFEPLPDTPGAISGPVEVCSGGTDDYQIAAVPNANTYEWVIAPPEAGDLAGNGASVQVTWSSTYVGQALLKVRGVNECGEGAYSEELTIQVNECTGLDETASGIPFSFHPNPSKGDIVIDFKSGTGDPRIIRIVDLTGQVVFEGQYPGSGSIQINPGNIDNGIYFLVAENRDIRYIEKLIIRK
ncbi:MAG: S8 family serine peptidase [Bacteroidales bacterium]|nr:S8 family serine peptidase [Bacteroidales bacterium]